MMKVIKFLKAVADKMWAIFGVKGDIFNEAVDAGICDFSGQGRDRYGR